MSHFDFKHPSAFILQRIFPPPEFLRMNTAGIDISDNTIRFIEFGTKGNKRFVKSFGEKKLPPGAIVSGLIEKPKQVIEVLSSIKKETDIFLVNASLPEEKAYLFKMQVPKVEDEELYEAIGFRIEENVPISAKEAIYDYIIVGEGKSKDSDHIDAIVSVIPSKVSENYADVIKAAGFMPVSFEISSQAISRAVVPKGDNGSYLVINFGETKTGMAIVNKGIVFFSSTIPFGAKMLDESISKVFGVSISQVPVLKSEILSSGKQDMDLFLEVMNKTDPLKEEILKLSAYWRTHGMSVSNAKSGLEKIVLCGSDTIMPSVDEYTFASTGIKTEIANVWQNIFDFEEYIPPISHHESMDYAGAIGLAISH